MDTTSLRKIGGSVVQPEEKVGLAIPSGRLVVQQQLRPRYTLNELLAQCDPKRLRNKQDLRWLSDWPRGRELI